MNAEVLVADVATLAERVAADFEVEGRRALAARGRVTIALPGGSVASHFFPHLAHVPLDWSAAEFFWVDERAVAASHPESNYGAARVLWLEPAAVATSRIHRMPADAADPVDAAERYAEDLLRLTGAPPRIDLVLLGVGPDGHVASLFPGHDLLHDEHRWVAFIDDAPKAPRERMTLTMPALCAAERVVIAAFGASKAAALRDALERSDSPLPVAMVARRALRPLFLMDAAAASLLDF